MIVIAGCREKPKESTVKSVNIRSFALAACMMVAMPAGVLGGASARPLPYTGTNLSGGEFYTPKPDVTPIYGTNFSYPTPEEFDYFSSKGLNIFRLQFYWETLQPVADGPFRQEEIDRLAAVVNGATKKGLTVIIDPHNYARYYGKVLGTPDVPADAFADFWGRLASVFKNNKNVWFGLVNEPHDIPADVWLQNANGAIAAIRKAGAKNLILAPGNSWTGANGWLDGGENSNGVVMLKIKDPANHYIFEAHQYLDSDQSGSHPEIVSATIGSERLKRFTEWCRQNHKKAFLGEFGVAVTPISKQAVDDMVSYMEVNRDVWTGYTWWSAGPRWGDYMFSIEPKNGVDAPQLAYLEPHLQHRKK